MTEHGLGIGTTGWNDAGENSVQLHKRGPARVSIAQEPLLALCKQLHPNTNSLYIQNTLFIEGSLALVIQ